ncbi:MAG: hypothetical protein IKO73_08795 [Bacteroidaceae bacterium]|nr:hypothetical protein [Bacteroidaceae bacterium]MBR6276990.1 hypothetical protein [Prevotella sp.]
MKKNYIAPNSRVVKLRIKTHLMNASITGTNIGLSAGGSTTTADSRNDDWWDDEE